MIDALLAHINNAVGPEHLACMHAQVVSLRERRIADLELLAEADHDGPMMPSALNDAVW